MADEDLSDKQASFNDVQKLATRFVELANTMKDEGHSPSVVNGGLMFASCIYATYSTAGNDGYLHDSGIDKVAGVYRRNLARLQKLKKAAQA